jgi:hypothetical protein
MFDGSITSSRHIPRWIPQNFPLPKKGVHRRRRTSRHYWQSCFAQGTMIDCWGKSCDFMYGCAIKSLESLRSIVSILYMYIIYIYIIYIYIYTVYLYHSFSGKCCSFFSLNNGSVGPWARRKKKAVTAEDTFAFGSGTKPYTAPCLKMLATHGYPQNQWFGTEDLDRFGTFFQHMCKDNFLGPMIRHPYGEWLSFWVNPQMSLVILFWHLVDSFELQSNSADGPQCSLIHYFSDLYTPEI